ncbi:MAG: hypothetical protein M3464_19120 [Chloroflexota bacterium]|nr:hypothetical protein [Chloroflexota bacterium]
MDQQQPNHRRPATDQENASLPPIPDGGLARAMPEWLREGDPGLVAAPPTSPTDPMGFITEDDLPPWLRHLTPEGAPAPRLAVDGPAIPAAAEMPAAPLIPLPIPASPRSGQASNLAAGPTASPVAASPGPLVSAPGPGPKPRSRDHRALVAIAGGIVLALTVLAYLYARGLL